MVLLEVKDLTKIFNVGLITRRSITAVDRISFNINEGEILSLVGESGSGKTTTAKIILRLLKPSAGSVVFMGKDIWKDIKSKEDLKWYWRNVNAVFQDPYSSLNPTQRIVDVLFKVFKLFNEDFSYNEKLKYAKEALHAVGLNPDEVLFRRPFELSGGMRQRILLARIFIIKPRLLIADEPTSMIDATLRISILNNLLKLRDEYGTSIMFITHDLGLAYYVSNRILVMYRGKIIEEGTPDEIVSHPKHEYTKTLLESVPKLYRKWS